MSKYPARAMGNLSWFLGMRILRDEEQMTIYLCQDSYIEETVKHYSLDTSKRPASPCASNANLTKYDGQASKASIKLYQQKVGSALYAAEAAGWLAAGDTARFLSDIARAQQKADRGTSPARESVEKARKPDLQPSEMLSEKRSSKLAESLKKWLVGRPKE